MDKASTQLWILNSCVTSSPIQVTLDEVDSSIKVLLRGFVRRMSRSLQSFGALFASSPTSAVDVADEGKRAREEDEEGVRMERERAERWRLDRM
jgi:hypothetical protein